MRALILIGCALSVGCTIRPSAQPSSLPASYQPDVIRIDLLPNQKVSRITLNKGELLVESRQAYADEQAEEIFYTTYNAYSGVRRQRYIVTEHITAQ